MLINVFNRFEIRISKQSHKGASYGDLDVPRASLPCVRDNSKENVFCHIHMPKTGGTTFNSILERNFGKKFEPHMGRLIHFLPYIENAQLIEFLKYNFGIRCITSHMFRAILPYKMDDLNAVGLACIRNPVDKFFSMYFHLRHFDGVGFDEKTYLLDDYIDVKIKQRAGKPFKGYLDQLTGYENRDALRYLKDLCKSQNLYLIPIKKIDAGLAVLKDEFPDEFSDVSYKTENISKKDQEVTPEMKEKVGKHISDLDWELLEFAEEMTDTRAAGLVQ